MKSSPYAWVVVIIAIWRGYVIPCSTWRLQVAQSANCFLKVLLILWGKPSIENIGRVYINQRTTNCSSWLSTVFSFCLNSWNWQFSWTPVFPWQKLGGYCRQWKKRLCGKTVKNIWKWEFCKTAFCRIRGTEDDNNVEQLNTEEARVWKLCGLIRNDRSFTPNQTAKENILNKLLHQKAI